MYRTRSKKHGGSSPRAGSSKGNDAIAALAAQVSNLAKIVENLAAPAESKTVQDEAGGDSPEVSQASSKSRDVSHFIVQHGEKELPQFDGDPAKWANFISHFERSTLVCRFSDAENLGRLQKALKGDAYQAVYALLAIPEGVPEFVRMLERRFGRPELVIRALQERLLALPNIAKNDFKQLVVFSSEISNYVVTVELMKCLEYLMEPIMLGLLVAKLPVTIQVQWGERVARMQLLPPRINEFGDFLEEKAEAYSCISKPTCSFNLNVNVSKENSGNGSTAQSTAAKPDTSKKSCRFFHAGDHTALASCPRWEKAQVNARWSFASTRKLCFKCLGPGNPSAPKCRSQNCKVCDGFHHTTLHRSKPTPTTESKTEPKPTNSHIVEKPKGYLGELEVANAHRTQGTGKSVEPKKVVLLRVLPVRLFGPTGSTETYALLDDGSTISMIDSELAKQVGIRGKRKPLTVSWTGDVTRVEDESEEVAFGISGVAADVKKFEVYRARTVSKLNLPKHSVDVGKLTKQWPFVEKAPVRSFTDGEARILIGQDNWPLLQARKSFSGPWNGPIVTQTWLGWVVHGNVPNDQAGQQQVCGFHVAQWEEQDLRSLGELVEKQILNESFRKRPENLAKDSRAVEIFKETTERVGDRWETGLLWKDDRKLPESRRMALRRLFSLEFKLKKEPVLASKYQAQMADYVRKGYARKLSPEEIAVEPTKTWYLPHLGVTNPNKPKKLRVCFDASAKSHGLCLNDFAHKGDDLFASLPGLLLKFRQYPVGVTADIQEMYSQIRIRKEDQDAQRYFWRDLDDSKPPNVYVMQTVMFGTICSPFSAQMVRNLNAKEFLQELPEAVQAITSKHCMDDYIESCVDADSAIQMCANVSAIHAKGGFHIRGWATNSTKVREAIPVEARSEKGNVELGTAPDSVLGLIWETASDLIRIKNFITKPNWVKAEKDPPTKRLMLQVVMSVYDPLGMIVHGTIQGRQLLQEVWKAESTWDAELSGDLKKWWGDWLGNMKAMSGVKFPRCYSQLVTQKSTVQLHLFCDASEKSYGAVAYLRFVGEGEKNVEVSFVLARAYVAPVKLKLTIPRLELKAAVVAVELRSFIVEQLDFEIERVVMWTDNQAVLGWIRSENQRLPTFVSNRVGKVRSHSGKNEWRWVPTLMNPADCLTRWRPDNAKRDSLWFLGPSFLLEEEANWPRQMASITANLYCEAGCFVGFTSELALNVLPRLSQFPNWSQLVRATAWVHRFANNLRNRPRVRGELTPEELERADTIWCRKVQEDSFPMELDAIEKKLPVAKSSRLAHLFPFLNPANNLLCVRGRLGKAGSMREETKTPVILDPKHPYTKLLVQYYHVRMGHRGQETVFNEVRLKYWVLNGRAAVRRTWAKCQPCIRRNSRPMQVVMGELPAERLEAHVRPLTNVGMDYFGPMQIKVGQRHEKRYGCIFMCLSIRAVHIEVVHSLTADGAIMAIRRFAARRGYPRKILSDNGTNLRGAARVLRDSLAEWNQNQLKATLGIRGVRWAFNPPGAPHMGGIWERMIRTVKSTLEVVLNGQTPTDEVLVTLMAEVEGIVNSRPLTRVSSDYRDKEALTPNHFLIGTASLAPMVPEIPETVCLARAWRTVQQLAGSFWRRWVKEYIPELLVTRKWRQSRNELSEGDVVMVADTRNPRAMWPTGVICKLYSGADGKTRVVDVRTNSGIIRRAITSLYPLHPRPPGECCDAFSRYLISYQVFVCNFELNKSLTGQS